MSHSRTFLPIALLLFIVQFSIAQEDWIDVRPAEVRMRAQMPTEPSYEQRVLTLDDGSELEISIYLSSPADNSVTFSLTHNKIPQPPTTVKERNQVFDNAIRGSVERVTGKLLVHEEFKKQGVTGRSIVYTCTYQDGTELKIKTQYYIYNGMLFQLSAVFVADQFLNEIADKFLGSIQFTKEANPAREIESDK